MASSNMPPIILFGYDSSPFTQKVRLALALLQLPYTFILVPTMMPRPLLLESFNLTYRKIPILAIGKDLYIDTSLILEALHFLSVKISSPESETSTPASQRDSSVVTSKLHPTPTLRALSRLISSHYTDRPLFRLTTGLIPPSVWSSSFGRDRAALIGHTLSAGKLGQKVPRNLSALDTYLSILEPLFISSTTKETTNTFIFDTPHPTAADISIYYQLAWGLRMSNGQGINDLTGGEVPDSSPSSPSSFSSTTTTIENLSSIFTQSRYPNLYSWFQRMETYFSGLPNLETRIERSDDTTAITGAINQLKIHQTDDIVPMIPTPTSSDPNLESQIGLVPGTWIEITPDDTGRDDPTIGKLICTSTQEVVIQGAEWLEVSNHDHLHIDKNDVQKSQSEKRCGGGGKRNKAKVGGKRNKAKVDGIRIHFPRVGFVFKPVRRDDGDGDGDGEGNGDGSNVLRVKVRSRL